MMRTNVSPLMSITQQVGHRLAGSLTRTSLLMLLVANTLPMMTTPAYAQEAATSSSELSKAIGLYDNGNVGEALPIFERIQQQSPQNDTAQLWLAKALMKQGGDENYTKAKTHLIQALTVNPDNAEALMHLGTINGWDPSRRGQAIQMLSRALELKGKSPEVTEKANDITKNLVQLLIWDGRYPEAAQYAQPIRQAFASDTKWQAVYANLLTRLGQHTDSIALYESYIKPFEQPSSPEALQWRMDYLYALRYGNQGGKAQQLFDQLYPVAIAQKNDDLLNSLGGIAYELGQYSESVAASNAIAGSLRTSHDVQLRNARAYLKLQQWQPAIAAINSVYQRQEMTADEKLEFAEALAGNQVPQQYLPSPNFVDTLYADVASNPKYQADSDIQLRIARHKAQQDGNTPMANDMGAASDVPNQQAIDAYYHAIRRSANPEQAKSELVQYLMLHKGRESQAMLGRLAQEYPKDASITGAYAEYLTWDEATRKQGIRGLIQTAQMDRSNQESWLEKLDEVLGWQPPTEDLKPEYQAILALDPTHPAAQTAMRELQPKLPEVSPMASAPANNPGPTYSHTTPANDPWTVERTTIGGPSYRDSGYSGGDMAVNQPAVQPAQASVPSPQQNHPHNAAYPGSYRSWGPQTESVASNAAPAQSLPPVNAQPQSYTTQPYSPYSEDTSKEDLSKRKFDSLSRSQPETTPVGQRYQFSNQPLASNPPNLQKPWQTSTEETLTSRIEEAKQLTYDRHYRDALELFDDALQVEPSNRDAQLGKAYALLWSGRKYAAKRIIEKLYRTNPNDVEVVTALAEVHKTMGRPDKALDLLRDARQQTDSYPPRMSAANPNVTLSTTVVWDFMPTSPAGEILIPCRYERPTFTATAAPLPALQTSASPANSSLGAPLPAADIDALNAELDALNSAIQSVQAVQDQSDKQIGTLQQDVWETRQMLSGASGNSATEYDGDHNATWHNELTRYYGQSMMAYDDPSRVPGYSPTQSPLPAYLDDRISNLENDLFDDLRPEFRVGYMYQTQDGGQNTTKTSIWGVPNQLSFSLLPQLRVRGGVVPQRFYLPSGNVNPRSNMGMLYTAGFNFKPFDRVGFDGDFGVVNFSQSDHTNFNYRGVLTFDPWDRVRLKVGSRRLTLANSLLSVAGFTPNKGAYAGQRLGPANETSVFAELNLLPFTNVDVNVAYEFGHIAGKNFDQSSNKHQVYASAGYTHRFNDKHWARLGYQFLYMGFSNNAINGFFDVTNFGATQPVVSMNPTILADPGYDFGGYFSPSSFFLNAARLDYRGSLFNRFLEYQLGGSIGVQSYAHGNGISDSSPTSLAYSFDASVRMNFTDWLSAYGRYNFLDSGGFFQRHRVEGGLIIRPYIEALSPVFGEKMPKSDNFRKRDSQFPFVYDNFEHFY